MDRGADQRPHKHLEPKLIEGWRLATPAPTREPKPKSEAEIARLKRRKERRQKKATDRLNKLVTPKDEKRLARATQRAGERRRRHVEQLRAAESQQQQPTTEAA